LHLIFRTSFTKSVGLLTSRLTPSAAMTDRFSPDLDTCASRRHTRASPRTALLRGRGFCGSCLVRGGLAPLARTFGMETREDTVQFRRRTSVSGTIDRSAVKSPPPRKTVVILVGGHSVSARPVRSGVSSCPGRVGVRGTAACGEGASPLPCPPPPGVISTTVPCPESVVSWLLHGHHCLTRAVGDPHQNPQNKMIWSTTVLFHLILSMQYHLTRGFPCAVAIAHPASGPAT